MTVRNAVTAPLRLCRRFEQWAETPGKIEAAIRVCDRLTPVIFVTAASMLVGMVLAGVIILAFHR